MDEISTYEKYSRELEELFESYCTRCGRCCGSTDGDPCEHLNVDEKGMYFCDCYEERLGAQKTVSGEAFSCVPILEHIRKKTLHLKCGYKKYLQDAQKI